MFAQLLWIDGNGELCWHFINGNQNYFCFVRFQNLQCFCTSRYNFCHSSWFLEPVNHRVYLMGRGLYQKLNIEFVTFFDKWWTEGNKCKKNVSKIVNKLLILCNLFHKIPYLETVLHWPLNLDNASKIKHSPIHFVWVIYWQRIVSLGYDKDTNIPWG